MVAGFLDDGDTLPQGWKWKQQLEQLINSGETVSLLAIGKVKYEVLAYLSRRKDIQIFRLETRYLKNRRKGLGLKVTVRKLSK